MRNLYNAALLLVLFGCANITKATNYYLKSSGTITTLSSWGTNTNGTGTAPGSFTTGGDVFNVVNRSTVTLSAIWNLATTNTVVIGDGSAAVSFTVSGGLGKITGAYVNVNDLSSLTLSNTTFPKLNNLTTNSTIVYNTSSYTVKPASYGNLTIATSNTLDGSTGDIFTYGALTINAGKTLTMNAYSIYISGTIAGTGTIVGDNAAIIYLLSSTGSNIGTLNFQTGSQILNGLYVGFGNVTTSVSLGTDLKITGSGSFYDGYMGNLNLNGHTLTLDATSDANFEPDNASGGIIGSASSSLFINSATFGVVAGGSSTLYMDQGSTANSTLKALSLNSPGNTLSLGNALYITDSLTAYDGTIDASGSGGSVTLQATNTLKGRLGRMSSTGSISGNITVQTFAKGGSAGWAELGVSGVTGQSISNWEGQIVMTCQDCPNGPTSAGGYFVSIQSWDGSQSGGAEYVEMTYHQSLDVGIGYWIYLASSVSSASDMTWSVTGPAVQGNVSIPIVAASAQSGYNLVSNPYASPVSWTKIYNTGSNSSLVNGAIYIYNADSGTSSSYVAGVSSTNGTSSACDIIPVGQGFYVQASSAGSLSLTESVKSNANTSTNPLLKTANTASTAVGTVFRLNVTGANGDYDETAFRFHPSATTAFDGALDAHKIFQTPGYNGYPGPYSQYTTISSQSPGEDYSINSLPEIQSPGVTIPVLVKVSQTGQYTIAPGDLQNLPPTVCVTLTDKLTNTVHDLRTGGYTCTIGDTTSTARFVLNICADNITTSIANADAANNVLINQDLAGAYVKTVFAQDTKAVISAYNVMGQQLMADKTIEGKETMTYLNLNAHDQVVIIKVTTSKGCTVKRLFMN